MPQNGHILHEMTDFSMPERLVFGSIEISASKDKVDSTPPAGWGSGGGPKALVLSPMSTETTCVFLRVSYDLRKFQFVTLVQSIVSVLWLKLEHREIRTHFETFAMK